MWIAHPAFFFIFFLFRRVLCLHAPWPPSIEPHCCRQHNLHGWSSQQQWRCRASPIVIVRHSPPADRPQLHRRLRKCQHHVIWTATHREQMLAFIFSSASLLEWNFESDAYMCASLYVCITVCAQILGVAHLLVSLGIVVATDKYLKQAFLAASIKFPSALFGMFCVFSVLVVLDAFVPALAKAFMDFFEPATLFIQRWLPLFYVPSLVVLPLAVRDVPAASGLKILTITCTYLSRSYCTVPPITSLAQQI
jgi:hypothetical protein